MNQVLPNCVERQSVKKRGGRVSEATLHDADAVIDDLSSRPRRLQTGAKKEYSEMLIAAERCEEAVALLRDAEMLLIDGVRVLLRRVVTPQFLKLSYQPLPHCRDPHPFIAMTMGRSRGPGSIWKSCSVTGSPETRPMRVISIGRRSGEGNRVERFGLDFAPGPVAACRLIVDFLHQGST
jgi:hypothetical protein